MTTPAELLAGSGAGTWTVDGAASSARFRHKTMWGLVTVKGTLGDLGGQGEVNPDGSVAGVLTISPAALDTKNSGRDKHLRSPDFFHVEEHPAVTYTVAGAHLDDSALHVEGTLTIKAVTRPLSVTAQVTDVSADAVTLAAEVVVDRAEFGLGWNRIGMITGPATVSVVARFTRQPG